MNLTVITKLIFSIQYEEFHFIVQILRIRTLFRYMRKYQVGTKAQKLKIFNESIQRIYSMKKSFTRLFMRKINIYP